MDAVPLFDALVILICKGKSIPTIRTIRINMLDKTRELAIFKILKKISKFVKFIIFINLITISYSSVLKPVKERIEIRPYSEF